MSEITSGLVGDLHEAGNSLARKAWRARELGMGMRLTDVEVIALHELEGDGDWWNSFDPRAPLPAHPAKDTI